MTECSPACDEGHTYFPPCALAPRGNVIVPPPKTTDDLSELFAPYVAPQLLDEVVKLVQRIFATTEPDFLAAAVMHANEGFSTAQHRIAAALGMKDPHQQSADKIIARAAWLHGQQQARAGDETITGNAKSVYNYMTQAANVPYDGPTPLDLQDEVDTYPPDSKTYKHQCSPPTVSLKVASHPTWRDRRWDCPDCGERWILVRRMRGRKVYPEWLRVPETKRGPKL